MAEQLTADVGEEQGAPGDSPSSERADQPTYVTREDHESAIRWLEGRVADIVNRGFQGTQAMFDKKVAELSRQSGLSAREAAEILEEVGGETIGAERIQGARDRAKAKADAEAAAAAEAERIRNLEEQVKVTTTVAEQQRLAQRQTTINELWAGMEDRMAEMAEEQGVDAKRHIDAVKKEHLVNGRFELDANANITSFINGFEKKVKASIAKAADARLASTRERPDTDTSPGGGGTGTAYDNYIKALREGKPLPSPAEIDRITAGRYA